MTERDLFLAALDIPDPTDRAQFLVEKCGPDAELRRKSRLNTFSGIRRSGELSGGPG